MMILLAMALMANDYPLFDPAQAASVCEAKRKDATWSQVYADNAACVAAQRADYNRFTVVAEANAPLKASFTQCVTRWSAEGGPDWSMIEYCAVGQVDGKRDFALLRRAAPAIVRPAIDKCAKAGEGGLDWDEATGCARDQISGHRDYLLFRARAGGGKAQRAIDGCREPSIDTEDGVVDWQAMVECAARGGTTDGLLPTGDEAHDEEIVVT